MKRRTLRLSALPAVSSGTLPVRVAGRLPPDPVPVQLSVGDLPFAAILTASSEPGRGRLSLPEPAGLPDGRHAVIVAGAFSVLAEVDVRQGRIRWVEGLAAGTLAELGPPAGARPAPESTGRASLAQRLRRRWRRS